MKILVFTDVHGSLNALHAIEETKDFKTADKKIFLGDVVFGCSRPNECVEFLKKNKCTCILGNNDSYVVDHIPEVDVAEFDSEKLVQMDWIRDILLESNKKIISSWPREVKMTIDGKKFVFMHYPWENYNNDINVIDSPLVPNVQIRKEMFSRFDADYIIFGHEHQTSYFTDGQKHYFCIGSLGLKVHAPYLMIDTNNGEKVDMQEKFVQFDIDEEIRLMDLAGYPYAKNKLRV